jgi:hypothetical protein
MRPVKITATTIGVIAKVLLEQNREAAVIGVISRGVFLHFSSGRVIFISSEDKRGPLTINCPSYPRTSSALQPGDSAQIGGFTLFFPRSGLVIDWHGVSTWQATELPSGWLTHAERKSRLVELARRVLADPPLGGLSYLLPGLLDLPEIDSSTGDSEQLHIHLCTAQKILSEPFAGYEARLLETLAPFIGLGGGLTPSGDDLILGLLLVLNRWGQRLLPGLNFSGFNQAILERVDIQTTSISVSLIRCAAAGQADERIISAFDGLLTGAEGILEIERNLRSWGNSSGIDALVGMATVILACISTQ